MSHPVAFLKLFFGRLSVFALRVLGLRFQDLAHGVLHIPNEHQIASAILVLGVDVREPVIGGSDALPLWNLLPFLFAL